MAAGQSLGRYLLALSRPRFWLYLAGPALVGVVYAADEAAALGSPLAIALVSYYLLPANLLLYGVNDRFDVNVDTENPRKGEAGPEVQYRDDGRVWGAVLASGVVGLALVPLLPVRAAGVMVAFLVLSVAYSAPPLRLKTHPPLDSVSNGLYVLPGVVAYVTVAGAWPPLLAVLAGWLWTMGMHTFSAIPDVEPDRAAGIETTATALGADRALAYVTGTWLGAGLLGLLHHPGLGAVFLAYPALAVGIAASDVSVRNAYGWFPILNALAGTALTLGGLWRVVGGF